MLYLFNTSFRYCEIDNFRLYKDFYCAVFDSDNNSIVNMTLERAVNLGVAGYFSDSGFYYFLCYNKYIINFLKICKFDFANKPEDIPVFDLFIKSDIRNLRYDKIKCREVYRYDCNIDNSLCNCSFELCKMLRNSVGFQFMLMRIQKISHDGALFVGENQGVSFSILDIIALLYHNLGSRILNMNTIYLYFDYFLHGNSYYKLEIDSKVRSFVLKYLTLKG